MGIFGQPPSAGVINPAINIQDPIFTVVINTNDSPPDVPPLLAWFGGSLCRIFPFSPDSADETDTLPAGEWVMERRL